MSRKRPYALAGCALILVFAQLLLAWLHRAELDASLESLNQSGERAYVLWREMLLEGEAGEVVQQVNMDRSTAETIAIDLLGSSSWGLVNRRVEHGHIGEQRHALSLLDLEQRLGFLFNDTVCRENDPRPLADFVPADSHFRGQDSTLRFGDSARSHPISLLTKQFAAEAVHCVPRLDHGAYLIVLLGSNSSESVVADRLGSLGGQLYAGMSERIQVRDLEHMLLEHQGIHTTWLRTIRWALTIMFLISIAGLITLDALSRRAAVAVNHVLGASPIRQGRDAATRAAKWLLPATVVGLVWAGMLAGTDLTQIGSSVGGNILWMIGLCLAFAGALSFLIARSLQHGVSLHSLLKGNWSSAGGGILLMFWSCTIAVMTVAASLTASMHFRLAEFSGIDWGYDTQDLFGVSVIVPDELLESPLYRDRILGLLDVVGQRPEVSAATVLAPSPWRFKGMERVSGSFIQGFSVGPGFADTLRPGIYHGRDFGRDDMVGADVVVFQRPPNNEAMLRHFGRQIGTMHGFRWDPLQVASPALSFTPITRNPQSEFELVWRTERFGSEPPDGLVEELQIIFPEAIFSRPERVYDVIERRFETLSRFSMLGGSLSLSALILAVLLTSLVLAQILNQEHRSLAIRMALGATPQRALQHWVRRSGVAMLVGIGSGIWASSVLDGILRAKVVEYQPALMAAVVAVVCLLVIIVAVALLLASRRIARLDLLAALTE